MATQNMGNDLELAQIDYQRKQQLADALRKQSMDSPQGQMIGRRYVAPSFTQGLAKLMQADQANNIEQMNLADLRNARQAYDTRNQGEIQNFMSTMRGTPASESQNVAPDEYGQMTNQPIQNPAQAPNQAKALALALQSKNPMLQSMGGELMKREFTPREQKWEKASIHNPDGSITHGYADMNSKNPESTFRPLGTPEQLKGVAIDNQLINPITAAPMGNRVPKQANPYSDLVVPNPNGGVMPNQTLIDAKKAIQKAGAPNVQTVVNTGQKAFEGELGKLDAKQLGDWRDAAQTAQNTLNTVKNLREAEKAGAYSGGGANAKLAVANMVEGFTGLTVKGLVGSQLYNAEASKLVLDHVKALGANPSNADREFIEKTVPKLSSNSQAREQMAQWMEQKASQAIKNYEEADTYARANHGLGGYKILKPKGMSQPAQNSATAPSGKGGAKFLGFEK